MKHHGAGRNGSTELVCRAIEHSEVPSGGGAERRVEDRLASVFNASCIMGPVSYNVELMDVSATGARARIRQGLVPRVGQTVVLGLMDGRTIEASVQWVEDNEFGLRLSKFAGDVNDLTNFDDLGADFFRGVLRLQIARK